MKEKFYTPQIEEFHVGFEYELHYDDGDYFKKHTDKGCLIDKGLYDSFVKYRSLRVKCLDREDVESLGFEFSKSKYEGELFLSKKECKFGSNSPKFYELILGQRKDICLSIEEHTSYGNSSQKMYFTVKNKSELKRLLKQVGYDNKL